MAKTILKCSIPDCDRPRLARVFCVRHYRRWRKYGDPLMCGIPGGKRRWDIGRWLEIANNVATHDSDRCLRWTGYKDPWGYGDVPYQGGQWRVHRLAYKLTFADFDPALCVLHHCDNPSCYNPRHLGQGTNADNVRDRNRKGRQASPIGENHPQAKLTDVEVRMIRQRMANGEKSSVVAKDYGVHHNHITRIMRRQRWKHLV